MFSISGSVCQLDESKVKYICFEYAQKALEIATRIFFSLKHLYNFQLCINQ